jgi:hypothetical protein
VEFGEDFIGGSTTLRAYLDRLPSSPNPPSDDQGALLDDFTETEDLQAVVPDNNESDLEISPPPVMLSAIRNSQGDGSSFGYATEDVRLPARRVDARDRPLPSEPARERVSSKGVSLNSLPAHSAIRLRVSARVGDGDNRWEGGDEGINEDCLWGRTTGSSSSDKVDPLLG